MLSFLAKGLGPSGAAAASSIAELTSALIYLRLLVWRKLVSTMVTIIPTTITKFTIAIDTSWT
jgi:Na+-driven multidrug efflux pump